MCEKTRILDVYEGTVRFLNLIILLPFDSNPELYNFAPLYGGDVAQVVEHRTENP